MALKYDIQNENFDYFFLEQSAGMSEVQKERLPRELLYAIFNKGNRVNSKSSHKLGFISKLFVLSQALKKNWVIVIEGENGMSEEDYFKYKKLTEKRKYNEENAAELIADGIFVIGSGALFTTFSRLNYLSEGPAYNYLSKAKVKDYTKPHEYVRNMNFLSRFVSNYESQRKKIIMETGLNMPEWLTLTHLYSGEEMLGSVLYKEKYKYSYNSSAAKIKLSFGSLQNKGFVVKHGVTSGARLQITPLGKQKVNQIMAKYIFNC